MHICVPLGTHLAVELLGPRYPYLQLQQTTSKVVGSIFPVVPRGWGEIPPATSPEEGLLSHRSRAGGPLIITVIPLNLERTEKLPMGSIKNVVSEPIEGHEDYHMMVSSRRGLALPRLLLLLLQQGMDVSLRRVLSVEKTRRVKTLMLSSHS